jgi:hypothetical protein
MTARTREYILDAIDIVIHDKTARGTITPVQVAELLQDISDSSLFAGEPAVIADNGDTDGGIVRIYCDGTIADEALHIQGPAPIFSADQTLVADAEQAWTTFGTVASPADDTTVDDYVVRAHGYKVGNPDTVYVDESVLMRVTADISANALVLGGTNIFNSPQLGVLQAGTLVSIRVRADAADDWHWQVAIYPTRAPFDGAKKSSAASTIGTGSSWHTEITIPCPTHDGDQLEVAYAVRGRFNTVESAWSFIRARGILVVEHSGGTLTIVDHVTTWSNARIRAELDGNNLLIQSQKHATENWVVQADATSRLVGV